MLKTYRDYNLSVDVIDGLLTPATADGVYKLIYEAFEFKPEITYKRQTGIIGDSDVIYQAYHSESKRKSSGIMWDDIPVIKKLKEQVEFITGVVYNICIVQLYPTGKIQIKPHRDREMGPGTVICGLSLGATRVIQFANSSYYVKNKYYDIPLPAGSLYIMNPPTNDYWSHAILKDLNITEPRMSLTFRTYQPEK